MGTEIYLLYLRFLVMFFISVLYNFSLEFLSITLKQDNYMGVINEKQNHHKQVGVLTPLIRKACTIFSNLVPGDHGKFLMTVFS